MLGLFASLTAVVLSPSIRHATVPQRAAVVAAAVPPLPTAGDAALLERANEFLHSGSGFYTPPREELFSDEFIFRGPAIGPLNRADYLQILGTFGIYTAFPDIKPNAFGFTVDPEDPSRVWFLVRNSGTNTGPLGLGGLERVTDTARNDAAVGQRHIPFRHRAKGIHHVDELKLALSVITQRFLTGDRQ